MKFFLMIIRYEVCVLMWMVWVCYKLYVLIIVFGLKQVNGYNKWIYNHHHMSIANCFTLKLDPK